VVYTIGNEKNYILAQLVASLTGNRIFKCIGGYAFKTEQAAQMFINKGVDFSNPAVFGLEDINWETDVVKAHDDYYLNKDAFIIFLKPSSDKMYEIRNNIWNDYQNGMEEFFISDKYGLSEEVICEMICHQELINYWSQR